MSIEEQLQQYDQAVKLQEWADLFGFDIHMGRDECCPYVIINGETFMGGDVGWILSTAAKTMGMSEERLYET